jgi:hypothetical protein
METSHVLDHIRPTESHPTVDCMSVNNSIFQSALGIYINLQSDVRHKDKEGGT